VTFDQVMHTMSRDATIITAACETICARMTLDSGTTARAVHHRGVEIRVTTCRRGQCDAKKAAAIVATVRAISTTIAATEDRKSDSKEHNVNATVVTSAKLHASSRFCGGSRLLDTK